MSSFHHFTPANSKRTLNSVDAAARYASIGADNALLEDLPQAVGRETNGIIQLHAICLLMEAFARNYKQLCAWDAKANR